MKALIASVALLGAIGPCADVPTVNDVTGEVGRSVDRAKPDVPASLERMGKSLAKNVDELFKNPTPENEYWIGRSVAANVLAKHQRKILDRQAMEAGKLAGVTEYVNRVGQVLVAQAIGSVIVTVATFAVAMVVMYGVNMMGLLRVEAEGELKGLDLFEHGISAYPEYVITSTPRPAAMVTSATPPSH